jgi:L-fuconolactonase
LIPFPVVDAHLHLLDNRKFRYYWIPPGDKMDRPYLIEDYQRECGSLQVEKMVYLQGECPPAQYLEEVAWVAEIAEKQDGRIRGIVAWAPVEKGAAARPEIENLLKNKLVKGVRRKIQFRDDPGYCVRPDFIQGLKLLAEYGLSFDIAITYDLDDNIVKMVERCPEVSFILNHIGKPHIREKKYAPWAKEIKRIAAYTNVYCKVSSLATEADWDHWTIEDLRPYAGLVFERFGLDRTVYATDWPVANLAGDIPRCAETLERLMSGCTQEELRKVFHDNGERFYRI